MQRFVGKVAKSRAMRRAWQASHGGLAAIILFSICINVLKLATPFYVLQVLDRVISSRSITTLLTLTVITVSAVLVGVILEVIRRRMFMQWGVWIERAFGPELFRDSIDEQSGARPAKISKKLRDLSRLRGFVSSRAAADWLDLPWAPVFVAVVFLINPLLALIVLVAIVTLVILHLLSELATRESRQASDEASVEAEEWVGTAERNWETIGSLSMAGNMAERWRRSNATRLDEGYRSEARNVAIAAATRFLRQCLRIAGLGVGIWLVIEGMLTVGAVIAANVLMRLAFSSVEQPMMRWRPLVSARSAYRRVKAELAAISVSTTSVPKHQSTALLNILDLGHRYTGQMDYVFRHINVTVAPGEILGVIGPSASGKTTLSRCLTGLVRPRVGAVRLGDIDIGRLPPDDLANCIGYLPQEVRLFRGSVRDNIARMGDGNLEDVISAARLARMHNAILRLPEGYDTEISDDTPHLSGGQRKGIAMARAYYGWPRVIILDEPQANLDERTRQSLQRALMKLKSKGTIIVVTSQSTMLTNLEDKVILLGDSKVTLFETEEQLNTLRTGDAGKVSKRLRIIK